MPKPIACYGQGRATEQAGGPLASRLAEYSRDCRATARHACSFDCAALSASEPPRQHQRDWKSEAPQEQQTPVEPNQVREKLSAPCPAKAAYGRSPPWDNRRRRAINAPRLQFLKECFHPDSFGVAPFDVACAVSQILDAATSPFGLRRRRCTEVSMP